MYSQFKKLGSVQHFLITFGRMDENFKQDVTLLLELNNEILSV